MGNKPASDFVWHFSPHLRALLRKPRIIPKPATTLIRMPPKEYTTGTQASSIYCLHLLITYASNINEQGSTLAQLVGMAGPESTSTRRSRIDVCGRLTKQVDGGSFQAGSSDQHCKALRLAFGNFQAVGAASSESFGGWRRALDTIAQRVKKEFMKKELRCTQMLLLAWCKTA